MSPIKKNKVLKVLTNKYFIAIVVFLALVLFIDENNMLVIRSLRKEVKVLQATVDSLKEGIVQDSIRAERLKDNMDSIERYGRETYYMKRSDEDVFVVVTD